MPALWLGPQRGYLADWITQVWVRVTGRRVALDEYRWLDGPVGETREIGEEWFRRLADRLGCELLVNPAGGGLLADFDALAGPQFDPAAVDSEIRRFYERTTDYRLEVSPE